jgi:hypothetical protein
VKSSPHERLDDLAERGADDHANGEIDDISFHREVAKFLQHPPLLLVLDPHRH